MFASHIPLFHEKNTFFIWSHIEFVIKVLYNVWKFSGTPWGDGWGISWESLGGSLGHLWGTSGRTLGRTLGVCLGAYLGAYLGGVPWEQSESNPGAIWEQSGSNLGPIWGRRPRTPLGGKMCQNHNVFLYFLARPPISSREFEGDPHRLR